MAKRRVVFGIFLLFVISAAVINNILPVFYKLFVDAIPGLNFNKLLIILLLYLGARLGQMLLQNLAFLFGDLLMIDSAVDARTTIFKHVQDLDFAFHTNKSTGGLISAFKRGDNSFFDLYHTIHFRIIRVFVGFGIMLYFFSSLNILIAILSIVSFVLSLIAAWWLLKKNLGSRREFVRQDDRVSAVIVDNLINFETVKLFAKEVWEQKKLLRTFRTWKKALWDFGISFRYFDLTMGTIIHTSVFLILFISLKLTVQEQMSLGDFVLVVGFVNAFFPQVFDLAWGFRDLAKRYVDIDRYFSLLSEPVVVKDPKNPIKLDKVNGEIEFKNVHFSYKGGQKNALHGVSLKIRQGQSVALVGRSGSGKTTMVKALMRFYDLDRGKITVDDIDISKITKSHLRSFMGVVPQEPILFNNTIGYNIAYGDARADKQKIRAAAKLANIDDFIMSLPKRYKTNVGERGIKLSGGQKQRLAIARMILSDPEIIIFDEATSHLDSESEKLIQDAFWKAAKNKTTIVIAHRLSTIMRADKIVVMDKGKIVEIGSHKELLDKKSLYKHLWQLQSGG